MQERLSTANKAAWETKAYQAWLAAYGTPEELAEKLKSTNVHLLRYWLKYIGDPAGKRILNLLGSNGRKAISLALLGAEVTVVDISEENKRYATQVATAAGVEIDYICADALRIPDEEALGEFDFALMEFGVLHYFADLNEIFAVVRRRLRSQGRYLLTDYHPFARAWARTTNLTAPDGDYFEDRAKEGDVAFSKLLPKEKREGLRQVLVRGWTVGEIVTAVGSAGLLLRAFEEIPGPTDPRIPEFYTLVADKFDSELPPLTP
jgi:SAM-dependent methyltransferase